MIDLIFDTTAVESIFGHKGAAPSLLGACDGKAVIGTGTEATPREAAEAVVCLFAEGDSFGSRDESRLAAWADMAKANERFVKSNRQANCFEAKGAQLATRSSSTCTRSEFHYEMRETSACCPCDVMCAPAISFSGHPVQFMCHRCAAPVPSPPSLCRPCTVPAVPVP